MHFLEWKLLYFDSYFIEIYSQGSNFQYASIGSDNGMMLNKQQVIIWTKGGLVYWGIYASLTSQWVNTLG